MIGNNLTCCVCGDSAGKFKQHPNRDTGYGVCLKCVLWLTETRHVGPEEMKRNYGTAGINYESPTNDTSNATRPTL